ncbi:MAG: hypothetical protein ACXABY_17850, partial [Candidatus Thorarchaeota archaeon]
MVSKGDVKTPKERWLAVLERRNVDVVPMDYWATSEVTSRLMKHLSCGKPKEMYEKLHIDAVVGVEPKYVGPPVPEDSDVYGCRYRKIRHQTGVYRECVYHPLAEYKTVSEIKKTFESPSEPVPHHPKCVKFWPISKQETSHARDLRVQSRLATRAT